LALSISSEFALDQADGLTVASRVVVSPIWILAKEWDRPSLYRRVLPAVCPPAVTRRAPIDKERQSTGIGAGEENEQSS
jgi:hypothetical protein